MWGRGGGGIWLLIKIVFEVSLQTILYTLQGLIQLNYQKERYVQVSRSVKNSAVALTPQGGGLNVPLDPLRALNPLRFLRYCHSIFSIQIYGMNNMYIVILVIYYISIPPLHVKPRKITCKRWISSKYAMITPSLYLEECKYFEYLFIYNRMNLIFK